MADRHPKAAPPDMAGIEAPLGCILRQLQRIEGAVQFWIGDWLNYGERNYGEKYTQAVQEGTSRTGGTLANLACVAGQVESSRRRENLDFGNHQAVAPLRPREQDRVLEAAARQRLSVKQTPEIVREFRENAGELPAPDLRGRVRAVPRAPGRRDLPGVRPEGQAESRLRVRRHRQVMPGLTDLNETRSWVAHDD